MSPHRSSYDMERAARRRLESRFWRRLRRRYVPTYVICALITFGHTHHTVKATVCDLGSEYSQCVRSRYERSTLGAIAAGMGWPVYWSARAALFITDPDRWT